MNKSKTIETVKERIRFTVPRYYLYRNEYINVNTLDYLYEIYFKCVGRSYGVRLIDCLKGSFLRHIICMER